MRPHQLQVRILLYASERIGIEVALSSAQCSAVWAHACTHARTPSPSNGGFCVLAQQLVSRPAIQREHGSMAMPKISKGNVAGKHDRHRQTERTLSLEASRHHQHHCAPSPVYLLRLGASGSSEPRQCVRLRRAQYTRRRSPLPPSLPNQRLTARFSYSGRHARDQT